MNFSIDTKYFARWEPCKNEIPQNAVPGGTYTNGEPLYIGRQRIKQNKNEFIPGYIIPSKMELIVKGSQPNTKFYKIPNFYIFDNFK